MEESKSKLNFQKKIWITVAIIAFVLILLWVVKATFSVLLLVFAGALIAVFLQALAGLARKYFKSSEKWSIALAVVVTFLLAFGTFWLIGAKIQTQTSELIETIPSTIEAAKGQLNQSSFGKLILERSTSEAASSKLTGFGQQFFTSTFGVLGDLYVILFIGIFFALSPTTYIEGFTVLLPLKAQSKGKEVLLQLGEDLKNWLKGKLFSMVVVGILTAIGLAILGIKLWLVLAIIAGLISFIPNFGPVIAVIPAVLIALLESPETALYVVGLYIFIQFLESNFITPFVQEKMISLPPAMILIVQLLMGTLTGGWGLILATPLAVVVMVLVKKLYLEQRNRTEFSVEH